MGAYLMHFSEPEQGNLQVLESLVHFLESRWAKLPDGETIRAEKELFRASLLRLRDAVTQFEEARRRSLELASLAKAAAVAGFHEEAIRMAELIPESRDRHLAEIARFLAARPESRSAFLQLLPDCSYDFDTAYKMCEQLALLEPAQASAIAEIMTGDPRAEK